MIYLLRDFMRAKQKTKQLSYWVGEFGNQYVERNSNFSFFEKRKPFFKSLLKNLPDVKSILEVGCNIGSNLRILNIIDPSLKLAGVEPNKKAIEIAREHLPCASLYNIDIFDVKWRATFDLVFTANVLIHIADKELTEAYHNIYRATRKYILTIEYYSKVSETIPYRGLEDALFKRPYDQELLDLYPKLKIKDTGFLTIRSGFGRCRWWLFKK